MKKRASWVLWCLAALCAGMIFAFSSQAGPSSLQTSGRVVQWILPLTMRNYEQLPPAKRQEIAQRYQYLVRKGAHFLEFALLGLLVRLALGRRSRRGSSACVWLGATGYAALDEFHQLLIGSRSAMWQDVCPDSLGALTGVTVAAGIMAVLRRSKTSG